MAKPGWPDAETTLAADLLNSAGAKIGALELELDQAYTLLAQALKDLEEHNDEYHHTSKETVEKIKKFLGR